MEKEQIRAMIVAGEQKVQQAFEEKQKSCREAIKLLQATEIDKRLELIDYLFADKVEEVIEFHLRKKYVKDDLGFGV
jgi:hypothetical protein